MKRLEVMSAPEIQELMVRCGRAVLETAKGLDVEAPLFTLVIFTHPAIGQYASNADLDVGKEALTVLIDRLRRGVVEPIGVCKFEKPTMRECFLESMPKFFTDAEAKELCDQEIQGLVHCFAMGWIKCTFVNQGLESLRQCVATYPELTDLNWMPGPEWRWVK